MPEKIDRMGVSAVFWPVSSIYNSLSSGAYEKYHVDWYRLDGFTV